MPFLLIPGTGSNKSLHGKTVVLTGGNSGIGAETAKDLSNRGAEVFILCRDQVKVPKQREASKLLIQQYNKLIVHIHFY